MVVLTVLSAQNVAAVALAAVGAVLFGLAAVRQHEVVQGSISPTRMSLREHLQSALALIRQPAWLIGAVQAGLGGALHIVALGLAPITLVQPIGVLAVPVTVVATSLRERQLPHRKQVLGSLMSVAGITALTVFLLIPASNAGTVPSWTSLAVTVGAVLGVGIVIVLAGGRGSTRLRCVSLAATAAVLFGLNSLLIRTIGEVVAGQAMSNEVPVLVTAAIGLVGALPLGVWAMQTAYAVGSPQVVICCLTLIDPLSAVVGGRLLLNDGATITGGILLGVSVCALLAAAGVVLLSADYPVEAPAVAAESPDTPPAGDHPRTASGSPQSP